MRSIEHLRICISHECNLNCQHCYNAQLSPVQNEELVQLLTPIERIKSLIDFLMIEFQLNKISITGGEPLYSKVWPRTKQILEYAIKHGLEIQFNTNGTGDIDIDTLLDIVKDFKDQFFLHVSLDGINAQHVDTLRGKTGVMEKTLQFIKIAVDHDLIVRVRYTVTKENADEAVACYNYVSDLGVEAFLTKPIFPSGSALNNEQLFITQNDYKKIQLELMNASIKNSTRLHFPQPVFFIQNEIPVEANVYVQQCNCGSHAIYLSQIGEIFPCTYIVGLSKNDQYILGNIQTMDFSDLKELWLDPTTFSEYRGVRDICPSYEILTRLFQQREK